MSEFNSTSVRAKFTIGKGEFTFIFFEKIT